jgi:hypothetical protein
MDLKIYRISKSSINSGNPVADIINFSYEDQTDFTPQAGNTTDFDCEAFVVTDSGVYLFTKEWTSQQTTIYSIPKTPGTYSAVNEGTYDVNGLITGATYVDGEQLVVLAGYTLELISAVPLVIAPNSFVVLLYDFQNEAFFSGNKRKIDFAGQDDLQVEGIAASDGINYYLSNERYNQFNVTTDPQIHELDLSAFLSNYLSTTTNNFEEEISIYPNPMSSDDDLYLNIPKHMLGQNATVEVYTAFGKLVHRKTYESLNKSEQLKLRNLSSGLYIVKVNLKNDVQSYKLIKK